MAEEKREIKRGKERVSGRETEKARDTEKDTKIQRKL